MSSGTHGITRIHVHRIDEIHTLVGAGSVGRGGGGGLDIANLVKPALARGEFQVGGREGIGGEGRGWGEEGGGAVGGRAAQDEESAIGGSHCGAHHVEGGEGAWTAESN